MNEEQLKALDKIMIYLAQRDHSVLELQKKLSKNFDPATRDWVINYADEQGWLKTATELSRSTAEMLHRKRKGALYIQNYLKTRGLPRVHIDDERELEKCRYWLENKFALEQDITYEEKLKVARFLKNRGFLDQTIKKVLYENK